MALACGVSCSSTPEPASEDVSRQQIRLDNDIGGRLAAPVERELRIRKDVEVSLYLRRIAEVIASESSALASSPIGVMLIDDVDGRWRSFALPGIRVYLSLNLLKQLAFENEIAAAIALELAHVANRDLLRRLEKDMAARQLTSGEFTDEAGALGFLPGADEQTLLARLFPSPYGTTSDSRRFTGPEGLIYYTDMERAQAVEDAVNLLYRIGYDARGLISLWNAHKSNPDRSPYSSGQVDRFMDRSYRAIAGLSPLRNPIVKTEKFIAIQKRIQKL